MVEHCTICACYSRKLRRSIIVYALESIPEFLRIRMRPVAHINRAIITPPWLLEQCAMQEHPYVACHGGARTHQEVKHSACHLQVPSAKASEGALVAGMSVF